MLDSCTNLSCSRVSEPGWIPLSTPTGGRNVFRESFHLRDAGGEGGELFSGRVIECVRNTNPASEGVLYCVCIFLKDSSVYLNVMKKKS